MPNDSTEAYFGSSWYFKEDDGLDEITLQQSVDLDRAKILAKILAQEYDAWLQSEYQSFTAFILDRITQLES